MGTTKAAAKLPRPRTAHQIFVETLGFFMSTSKQTENFRAKMLEQDLGSPRGTFARANSTQGSPLPGHQTASKVPGHRLIQGLELTGFRRTKELTLFVTPRPAQFLPRFCHQQGHSLLSIDFPQVSPLPSPNHLRANDQYFTPPCRAAFCWVSMAHQPSSSSICAGERRNYCSIYLRSLSPGDHSSPSHSSPAGTDRCTLLIPLAKNITREKL